MRVEYRGAKDITDAFQAPRRPSYTQPVPFATPEDPADAHGTTRPRHRQASLLRIQGDLRRLNIIRTNQGKLVVQMQELVARYNKSETLASDMQKKVEETVAGIIDKLG